MVCMLNIQKEESKRWRSSSSNVVVVLSCNYCTVQFADLC